MIGIPQTAASIVEVLSILEGHTPATRPAGPDFLDKTLCSENHHLIQCEPLLAKSGMQLIVAPNQGFENLLEMHGYDFALYCKDRCQPGEKRSTVCFEPGGASAASFKWN